MSKRNLSVQLSSAIAFGSVLLTLAATATAAPLTPGDPILLPGVKDRFDFIRMDTANNRLLLGHEGNKTFDVFDLDSKKLLKAVATSTSQDATTDVKRGCYYVSGNDPGRMVIVDSTKLEIAGDVPVPADTDLIAYNPNTGLVYECNDTAGEVWVIDPAAKKIVTTIKLDGKGVEDLAFDPQYQHLYQAVKGTNAIAMIDPLSNQVQDTWPLAPDKGPHGIAVVPDSDGLLVACANKLVLMDRTNGKILSAAPIGGRVDEMAYDPGLHIAYCASRQGKISCVSVSADSLTSLGDVPDQAGTGSITVDPKTHTVWNAYSKGDECYVQPFTPAQ